VSAALLERIKDLEHTCAKLHDLNHMQAQRIEVLQTQCETRAKRIYELEQENLRLQSNLHVIEHGIKVAYNGTR
jgi:phage shock protein A